MNIGLSWGGRLARSPMPAGLGTSALRAAATTSATPPTPGHLDRLGDLVRGSADRGERALACHLTAETHVNAALYEIDRLRDELDAVIGRSRTATAAAPVAVTPARTGAADKSKVGIAA